MTTWIDAARPGLALAVARGTLALVALAGLTVASCGESSDAGEEAACRDGEVRCSGGCTLLGADADHCGGCEQACPEETVCSAGSCDGSCGAGLRECSRACVDTETDARHCGGCGRACTSREECRAGGCVPLPDATGGGTGGTAAGAAAGDASAAGSGGGGPPWPDGGVPDAGAPGSPPALCVAPIGLVDVSSPDSVVGDGTPGSCTRQALQTAVTGGGVVTFSCGGAATIAIDEAIEVPIDRDVTVDGGGVIVLDGGRSSGARTRIFEFRSPNYRAVDTVFTVQRITLQNAEAPASDFTPQDPQNPRCAYGYKDGEGGAIYVRDGVLHVIDAVFRNNKAASPGPDTGGGAIFAIGSREVVVVGSVFEDNEGSNGGAIGLLQSDGLFFNSTFRNNVASGSGANFGGATECPYFNHEAQGGGGGNGAAIGIDGGSVRRAEFCGVIFQGNEGGALGTVTRTPNSQRERTTFDRCTFDGNHTESGGSGIYTQDMDLVIRDSTFSFNTADGIGGAVRLHQGAHGSTLEILNTTFHANRVTRALGGALIYDGPGSVKNCTFSENEAIGGYDASASAAFFGGAISGGGFRVDNTIFLDNRDTHPWTPMTCNVSEPLAGENNLQWPLKRVGEDGQPSDIDDNPCTAGIAWRDAQLGPLEDNGGPTLTRRPSADSPALGVGAECPATDQRGAARPSSGCAAGAVEPD